MAPVSKAKSAAFAIINRILELTVLKNANELISVAMKDFIVAAFAEEVVKFSVLKGVLKRKINAYTWADLVAFMVIIGTGSGLPDSFLPARTLRLLSVTGVP